MPKRTRVAQQQAMHECYVSRNHWWKWTTVDVERDYYVQNMVCLRCNGQRRWRVGKTTGSPMGNNYNMPEGYYHKREEYDETVSLGEVRNQLRLLEVEGHIEESKRKLRRVK